MSTKRKGNVKADADSIRVVCRFRPPKNNEIECQSSNVENFVISEKEGTIDAQTESSDNRKTFKFDKVFGVSTTQSQVFEEIKDIILFVMEGFNGTVLAYGQTSSGKTHTMEGPHLRNSTDQGIIPRLIECLFDSIVSADVHTYFTVSVSYFEIYCEKLRDLLNPLQDNLKIREKPDGDIWIEDVTEVYCTDKDGVLRVIEMGKAHRASAPTLMNAESSRSHSLLSVQVHQKDESTGRHKRGKLFLVDLAGSEKVSKTGAKGVRLDEAKNINKSLTTLGMVINALCDGQSHVPYRDSKLTRVLMESLGGNSKTTLIVCCAPEHRHSPETLSTLRFGERAKRIKNKAKVNEELSAGELKLLLQAMQLEVSSLKAQLSTNRCAAGAGAAVANSAEEANLDVDMEVSTASLSLRERLLLMVSAPRPQPVTRDEVTALLRAQDEMEEEIRVQGGTVLELTEELHQEREKLRIETSSKLQQVAEVTALKAAITELEKRFLEAKLGSQPTPPQSTRLSIRLESNLDNSSMQRPAGVDAGVDTDTPADEDEASKSESAGEPAPNRREEALSPSSARRLSETAGNHVPYSSPPPPPSSSSETSTAHSSLKRQLSSGLLRSPESIAVVLERSEECHVINASPAASPDFPSPRAQAQVEDYGFNAQLSLSVSEDAISVEGDQYGIFRSLSLEAENQSLAAQLEEQNRSRSVLDEEVRTLQRVVKEQAEQYILLREEYELHVQRLMMKLSHEQHARAEVEDRLEAAKQRLWKRSSGVFDAEANMGLSSRRESVESALDSHSDTGSSLHDRVTDPEGFEDMAGTGARAKRPSGDKRRKTLLSIFGESAKSAKEKLTDASNAIENAIVGTLPIHPTGPRVQSVQRERDLARQVTELEGRVVHLQAEMAATEQLHRMLVETKEVVTRSLFEQNASVTQERDILAAKVADLSGTVEQLKRSLESVQRLNLLQLMGDPDGMEGSRPQGDSLSVLRRSKSVVGPKALRVRSRTVSTSSSSSTAVSHSQGFTIQGGGGVAVEPMSMSIHGLGQSVSDVCTTSTT